MLNILTLLLLYKNDITIQLKKQIHKKYVEQKCGTFYPRMGNTFMKICVLRKQQFHNEKKKNKEKILFIYSF